MTRSVSTVDDTRRTRAGRVVAPLPGRAGAAAGPRADRSAVHR
ncbi:hypothetical protein [Micromonospora halophytica]|uniref:Uncharacterized protein n=1 Tax=Micromonospora halophytica TaxID=47864 RepID=A0A1C5HHM8_9ACTN|nr:hypothetical protein [Micromonospora halophytica]SCG45518.1 hypothetical protein GA0070560_104207 [Micromonospora halophytica]